MEKHTPIILTFMAGLLLGRFIPVHDLMIAEIAGLLFLILCYRGEIIDQLKAALSRPAVRAYAAPCSARVHGLVLSVGLIKKLAIAALIAFGALMLLQDAAHRYSPH